MKTTLIAVLFLSSMAFASSNSILLRSTTHFEFSPHPGTSTLTIDNNGKVEYQSPDMRRDGESFGRPLAQLSPEALQRVKAQVAELDSSQTLVDQDPEGPECMDAPSMNMMAYQAEKEVRFYSEASCHVFRMQDWSGYGLVELLKGLENLAR